MFPVRRLAPDGLLAWTQVVERGYEGYVAKDEAGAYEGGPTRRWLKVKQKGWVVEERLVAAADQRAGAPQAEPPLAPDQTRGVISSRARRARLPHGPSRRPVP